MIPLHIDGNDPAAALSTTQGLAYAIIVLASVGLLYYLYVYGAQVLAARETRRNLWYFAVGNVAAILYGATGLYALTTQVPWAEAFSEGATLFFIMFYALGFRSVYLSAPNVRRWQVRFSEEDVFREYFPPWLDYLIIGGYLAAWWGTYLFVPSLTDAVVAVGWLLASGWAFVWALLLVRDHEGTSLAALTRHLFPAVLAFTVTILADLIGTYVTSVTNLVTATWIVGTVLVGAFFITTAIALRQEGGEVERIYDWTTYRGTEEREAE